MKNNLNSGKNKTCKNFKHSQSLLHHHMATKERNMQSQLTDESPYTRTHKKLLECGTIFPFVAKASTTHNRRLCNSFQLVMQCINVLVLSAKQCYCSKIFFGQSRASLYIIRFRAERRFTYCLACSTSTVLIAMKSRDVFSSLLETARKLLKDLVCVGIRNDSVREYEEPPSGWLWYHL